ncbi:metal ABC transporter substrate-binding protein [Actinomyces gerencseriae]|jgi:zinc ABC transporter, zinc-binding protein adcA|uniref:metal ABC transporter substrate-binding protein n=1 Tax=Actinomyces gerencseriae TaxID=52769 RepID=UPI00047AA108|nr:metal ABC transporter substrate-binding protein [Actinomyces gerencseriae]
MNVPVVRRILSAAAAAALGLSLTACSALSSDSSGSKASGGAEGALSVAVSFYPIQYLTEAIGGDHVNVTSVTPAGQEPHDYDIPLETVNSLNNASLIAYVAGFQPSLDKAVTQVSGPTVVDLADKVDLKHHEGVEEEHSDDDEAGSAEKEQAAEDPDGSHDATHDHDHDADSLDPHFWLDPVRMTSAATAIEEALAAADPDHADDYKANLDSLTSTLDGLDSSYKGGLAQCERKTFITSHSAFGYLADRYGLTQVSISGIDPESSPSAAEIAAAKKAVEDTGATTIFTEELVSPETAEAVAGETGATTAVLSPIESAPEESDYAGTMSKNLDELRTALACQ